MLVIAHRKIALLERGLSKHSLGVGLIGSRQIPEYTPASNPSRKELTTLLSSPE
jgi:hypothetical protein